LPHPGWGNDPIAMSGRFSVGPAELNSAASSMRAVRGELSCGLGVGGGELGTGAMEGALSALAARLDMVAAAFDQAAGATAVNLDAGAESYAAVDRSAMPAGPGR
jgi:hypothetical protein